MAELTIGELAIRTGVRASALRFYEQAGVLPPPQRVNGRRRYGTDAVRRVELLRFAQGAGFTLAEIRALFHGSGAETPLGERWAALRFRSCSSCRSRHLCGGRPAGSLAGLPPA